MRKRKYFTKPKLLYLLSISALDRQGKVYPSPLYVGTDHKLSYDQLMQVTDSWLENAIDKRAKGVVSFEVVYLNTL